MKLTEFETKLGTVSDAKLRQMLSASRARGPEVAVKLILEECGRRGMEGLEESGAATAAYPQEHAGYAGADAPPLSPDADASLSPKDGPVPEDPALSEAPATSPDWLNEETRSGLPVIVKVLILVVVLGGLAGLAWKFTH